MHIWITFELSAVWLLNQWSPSGSMVNRFWTWLMDTSGILGPSTKDCFSPTSHWIIRVFIGQIIFFKRCVFLESSYIYICACVCKHTLIDAQMPHSSPETSQFPSRMQSIQIHHMVLLSWITPLAHTFGAGVWVKLVSGKHGDVLS